MIFTQSSNCACVITNGGAKRIILPCVGFANNPLSRSFKQIFHAVSLSGLSFITIAFNKPLPRISFTIVLDAIYSFIASRNRLPKTSAFSAKFSSNTTFRSEEHTSELQSRGHLVCRLLLEKKNTRNNQHA